MERLTNYWTLRHNSFETVRRSLQNKVPSPEKQCELIGKTLYVRIENGDITLSKVVEDILQYVKCKHSDDRKRYFCWLVLHLGLGLCCCSRKPDVSNALPRTLLKQLLFYSRGVDFGIFLRDLFDFSETQNGIPEKTEYLLEVCAGFAIEFSDPSLMNNVFDGPHGVVWREMLRGDSCRYLDLPIAYPTLPPDVDVNRSHLRASPLLLAIVNMKPKAVLLLLQHGAAAEGHPLEYILRMFSSFRLFPILNASSNGSIRLGSIDTLVECFIYCLRSVPRLTLRFQGETILEKPGRHVYYVSSEVTDYIPPFYTRPCSLKHLARCVVREGLLVREQLPRGLRGLILPEHLRDYLNLLC